MTIRVDFHIHTLSTESKDDGFEFSLNWLKKYTQTLKMDAIAITNHNAFDLRQFNQISDALDCIVLPGVELSLANGHVNLVFDNTENNKKLLETACKSIDLGSSNGLTDDEFKNIFEDLKEGLFIYEYGKSNSFVPDKELKDTYFGRYTFVRGVNSQLKFQRALLQNTEPCPALFSDAHATELDPDPTRNDISKLALKNTFLNIETFSFAQIMLEFKNSRHVTASADGEPNTFQIDVEGWPVTVSTKLNLIVGRRGSGKTFLLNHINNQYGNGTDAVAYIQQFKSSEATERFLADESARIAGQARERWVESHKLAFDSMVRFYKDETSDNVETYLGSLKRFAHEVVNTNIARKVKIFSESIYELTDIKQTGMSIKKLKEVIDDQSLWHYATSSKRLEYRKNVSDAYNNLRENYIAQKIEITIKTVVNGVMESIKNTVKKRTAIQPVDSIDLFHQFERQKEQAKIVDALQIALDEVLDVSEAEYSYTIHVWKGRWTSAEQFLKAAPRKGGKLAVKDDLIKPYLAKEYKTFLSNLFSQNYRTAFTLDSGLDLSRYLANFEVELLTDAGMPASGGQQMALGLMMKLDDAKKADIVLVDEPEGSLDNVFIKKELIPKLRELSESTPVFVITHNSTLGALLNPDRLLIAKFDSNERSYQLLSGDFFAKKVRSPSGQESQSYEAFVDAMEAGIGTYKEKGIQYENLRIE